MSYARDRLDVKVCLVGKDPGRKILAALPGVGDGPRLAYLDAGRLRTIHRLARSTAILDLLALCVGNGHDLFVVVVDDHFQDFRIWGAYLDALGTAVALVGVYGDVILTRPVFISIICLQRAPPLVGD